VPGNQQFEDESELPVSTLVVGLGSPLMGNDGVGLERLRAEFVSDPSLAWVDGGTAGLALLPVLDSARRILLLDAIDTVAGLVADVGARLRSWGHLGSVDTACSAVVGRS
jgi:hypothetical protein